MFIVFIFWYCLSVRSGISVINHPKLISIKTHQVSKLNGQTVIVVGVKNILVLFDSKLLTISTANQSWRINVSLDGRCYTQ